MKRRPIQSYKILAVALTTAATGCASVRAPETRSETPSVAIVPEAPAAAASADPVRADPKQDDEARPLPPETPALAMLRDELLGASRRQALENVAHFRPICDADGYPLVGNVVQGKGGGYEPSTFCREIRDARKH